MHGIINNVDVIHGIEKFWHGLNVIRSQAELNTFAGGALDFEVERIPLRLANLKAAKEYILDSNGAIVQRGLEAIVAKGNVLGVFPEANYSVVKPSELWETIRPLIDEFCFNVVSVGTIYGCKRVFITLESQDAAFKVGGDDMRYRVNLTSSFDGTALTCWFNSLTRIVCANTFNAALNARKSKKKSAANMLNEVLRKTKNAASRVDGIANQVTAWAAQQTAWQETLEGLTVQKISETEMLQFAVGLTNTSDSKLSTRAHNLALDIVERAKGGIGNANKGETRWDLLNGVTERYTSGAHEDPAKAFISSEFGNGSRKKSMALETLLDDEALEALCKRGEMLLASGETAEEPAEVEA